MGGKILQVFGSWALRKISNTNVRDAASGFRGLFKRNLSKVGELFLQFSYTMESLIQAGNNGLRLASVDIRVKVKKLRENQDYFKNIPEFIFKSGSTILLDVPFV